MIEKIAFSPKAKKISMVFLIVGVILIAIAGILPTTLKNKETEVLADKSLAVAETMSAVVSEAYAKELDYVRSNTGSTSVQYKKLSDLFIRAVEANNASRIFAVYKGVGGKYYSMLDTYHPMDTIGEIVNEKYSQKYKSIWDKISAEKIYSDYNMSLMDNEWGKSVIAWSALKNNQGKVIAILGVQNSLSNKKFNTFSLKGVYIILLISTLCLIIAIILIILSIKIFKECRAIHKGSEKKHFNKEKSNKPEKSLLTPSECESAEVLENESDNGNSNSKEANSKYKDEKSEN